VFVANLAIGFTGDKAQIRDNRRLASGVGVLQYSLGKYDGLEFMPEPLSGKSYRNLRSPIFGVRSPKCTEHRLEKRAALTLSS